MTWDYFPWRMLKVRILLSNVWIDTPNASGISNIKTDNNAGKYVIYNMGGQRLEAPQKGLNIINGRKVVIK